MEFGSTYLIMATVFGFFMAWGIGANDVANAMGTSVGSKATTLRQAIVIAMIFEFLGALLAGGEVTDTIRQGLLQTELFVLQPHVLVQGMLASLLATALWLALASLKGWPVSTTHTIVGAVVGFGCVHVGPSAVQWSSVSTILWAWLLSPLLGGILAFSLYLSVRYLILNQADPFMRSKQLIPFYIFFASIFVGSITIQTGFKHIGLFLSVPTTWLVSGAFALLCSLIGAYFLWQMPNHTEDDLPHFSYDRVERAFGLLMVFTGCAMAFAHGSNDVANAIGPLSAIASIVQTGSVAQQSSIPQWVMYLGAFGIVTGLLTYGHRVIATIGEGITQLTPTRGFAATLAAAMTVSLASGSGYPISTTHTLVGAVLGVGLARGMDALNLSVIRRIFMSWLVTLPAGASLSVLVFFVLQQLFQH